jgi:nitroimidazol reductase NimA-like FMN-containing flavoprotein (pyridoxamine 5'-phosphate oxidase superfamily)
VEVDRNGLEVLDRQTCLALLANARLGRIGCTSGALPIVLPVNFCLIGDTIVFRTAPGTKLDAATTNTVVAFEVDEMDAFEHSGWSVLVTGFAREVTNQLELHDLRVDRIPHWVPAANGRVVAVSTEMVSGRRIVPDLSPLEP